MMSSADDDEGQAPIDIKSRIASFNKKVDEGSQPTKPTQHGLRKTPSTSQLLPAYRKSREDKNSIQSGSASGPTEETGDATSVKIPGRPRAMTGGADKATRDTAEAIGGKVPSEDDEDVPKDVKSMIAMYGGKKAGASNESVKPAPPKVAPKPVVASRSAASGGSTIKGESVQQDTTAAPAVPQRPSIAISSSLPDGMTATPVAPQLPSRPVLQPEHSGSSTTSGSGSASASASAAALSAPVLPARKMPAARSSEDLRKTLAKASASTDSLPEAPSLPRRPGSRSSDNSLTDTRSGAQPPPPPRHHQTTQSTDALGSSSRAQSTSLAARRLQAAGGSTSSPLSASPSRATGSPRAGSSSPRFAQSRAQAAAPSTTVSTVEALAPPPRHIDTLRGGFLDSRTGVSPNRRSQASTPLSGAELLFAQRPAVHTPSQQGHRRRRRCRPAAATRPTSDFSCEPASDVAKARYEALFDAQIAEIKEGHGGADSLPQYIIVKLWRRSRLDSAFLGRVWQEAIKASQSADVGVSRDAFVRGMSAIDAELKQRRQRLGK